MKLARFRHGGKIGLGLVQGDGLIDIAVHYADAPATMLALIEDFAQHREAVAALSHLPADHAIADIDLLCPIERAGKIMGIGLNYADHVEESGMDLPADQLWFSKAPTSLNGPFDGIELPRASTALDYEAELAIIIGKRVRHVAPSEWQDAIFGYCVGNDATVRDWQFKTSQFVLGKSFDTHAPIGPWIVTADELDPAALDIRCYVNDELRQSSNTRHLIFDCAAILEHLSIAMTLEPGDVILTGTPSGVGAVMTPPRFLKVGDVVRTEIEGIGVIVNQVVSEA